ncbi:efflux transporter outer membrane subunit [Fluviicola sp.]|uniref:efflux transporter outer membrane subunit n=1 Tax=Fluviicola sp. TaxID=1917219 RepID=UPI002638E6A2|nr:efflux transporter outer membrane subunit [Fluviicola sp.]
MNRTIKFWILLAGLISACNVGDRYVRNEKELNMPESYRTEPHELTADTVMLDWKSFFKDPVLLGLIEKALNKNNEISIALMNMQQLELSYKQSKLGLLPELDLSIGGNRTWLSKNSLNGSLSKEFLGTSYLDDYNATVKLSWEVDIWGKAKKQKEGALASYMGQKENLTALKTRIVVQVAQAYYNLISLDEQLKIAQKNVELSDSTLVMIHMQYASSLVNSLAVEQMEAQKKTAELLIPLANQNIEIQENALSILCGEYPGRVERSGNLESAMPETVFAQGVPANLLSRRPDVKAAEYAIVAANSKAGLAKAAMLPSISITPSIGSNSYRFNSWFDLPGSLIKNVGANLTQPIFRRKELKTNHEVALLERDKKAVEYRQSVMIAVSEVSDALVRMKYTDQRLELLEQKAASLSKSVIDVLLLYKSGMATYLEVITAQNNALQNELEIISVRKEKLNAITDLYRSVGGGTDL